MIFIQLYDVSIMNTGRRDIAKTVRLTIALLKNCRRKVKTFQNVTLPRFCVSYCLELTVKTWCNVL